MDIEYEKRAALEARDRGETAYAQCGAHLRNVKAGMKHGEFLPWLKANKITADQAQRWMREAIHPEKRAQRIERVKEDRKANAGSIQHLPDHLLPGMRVNDPQAPLATAPNPDIPGNMGRAWKILAKNFREATPAQRRYFKSTIPRTDRDIRFYIGK